MLRERLNLIEMELVKTRLNYLEILVSRVATQPITHMSGLQHPYTDTPPAYAFGHQIPQIPTPYQTHPHMTVPMPYYQSDCVAQSDLEKAEEFNGQFTDVFNKNEHTEVPLLDRSAPFMNDIAVSKDEVIKLLKSLNPSKALRPDELDESLLAETT